MPSGGCLGFGPVTRSSVATMKHFHGSFILLTAGVCLAAFALLVEYLLHKRVSMSQHRISISSHLGSQISLKICVRSLGLTVPSTFSISAVTPSEPFFINCMAIFTSSTVVVCVHIHVFLSF
ncbi:hypothetical protein LSAT2_020186 [Lamellibrachia satsuma]|nr:hypothetical protein LSAT2_020186 [Lamellibrachia satsuma]